MTPRKLPLTVAAASAFAVSLSGATPEEQEHALFDSFPELSALKEVPKPAGPDWMHNAVFYQIYPQTFCDSDGDGIGDIQGIISKLDYVKSLGVDAIWINPFFESPFRDAGYDISDYYSVATRYGTNEDAKELFEKAHEKGLKVLFDFVASYTSIDHPWFKDSCEPTPNAHSNWYVWTNDTWFAGQQDYTAGFIQGYCLRNGNYLQNFFWSQPAVNFGYGNIDPQQSAWQLPPDHPDIMALREEMKNVVRFWMSMGADGYRADMASTLVKHDDEDKKYTCAVWNDIRDMLDEEFPGTFTVAEWEDWTASKAGFNSNFLHWRPQYYDLWFRNEDSYFLSAGKGDITRFLSLYLGQREKSGDANYISLTVGNHDLPRINRWGRDRTDLELIQVFAFTMPNVPFIYYGDEIAMRQLDFQSGKEGCYGTRAGARTPMQWAAGPNLGFSTAAPDKLWMPVDGAEDAPTVAAAEADEESMLHFMRELVAFRKAHPALAANGAFTPVYAQEGKYPFVFIRAGGGEALLVVINPSAADAKAEIEGVLKAQKALLRGSECKWSEKGAKTSIEIKGRSYAIYSLE
ncbi:MAG: hypothetical protein JW942_00775 [Opitutales bacterium]|nr:hypothetical protein [Opitutales bacterium]